MEFSPTGWIAVYEPKTAGVMFKIVEAWSPDGEALVVDTGLAKLVPASRTPGFQRLQPASRVVTAIPAAPGWTLRVWADAKRDDSTAFTEPIAAWIVDANGNLTPIGGTDDNFLSPIGNQPTEIIPPSA